MKYASQTTSQLQASIAKLRQKIADNPYSAQVDENWEWAIGDMQREINRRKLAGLQVVHRELRTLRSA